VEAPGSFFRTIERFGQHVTHQRQPAGDHDGERHVENRFDLLANFDPRHQPLQRDRNQDALGQQRQHRGRVNVRRVIEIRDSSGDRGQQERLRGEDAYIGHDPPLRHHGDLQHQHQRRHQGHHLVAELGIL
jgi:hypothetical protein